MSANAGASVSASATLSPVAARSRMLGSFAWALAIEGLLVAGLIVGVLSQRTAPPPPVIQLTVAPPDVPPAPRPEPPPKPLPVPKVPPPPVPKPSLPRQDVPPPPHDALPPPPQQTPPPPAPPAPVAAPSPTAEPVAKAVESAKPVVQAAPRVEPPPPPVDNAEVVLTYNGRLTAAVQAAFVVPSMARQLGFRGRARVEFHLRDGTVSGARIVQSSTLQAVDRAALQAVESASYPAPPAALIGKDGVYQIWVACF